MLLVLAGCRTDLRTELAEDDANEILDALYSAGIQGHKAAAGEKLFSVQVANDQLQPALRAMRERGLPRQRFTDLGTLFKKEGLVSTPSEERVRFIYGISQELAGTLTSIDGVVAARVHPVIPANDPMADKIKPSSASVFIKHDPNANVQALAPAIKNLVMRGIEGLNSDNITLTFVAADPPARRALATAALPGWLELVLCGSTALLLLVGSALGFVLWRYRQLAALSRAGAAEQVPWLRGLWLGPQPSMPHPAPGRTTLQGAADVGSTRVVKPVAVAANSAKRSG